MIKTMLFFVFLGLFFLTYGCSKSSDNVTKPNLVFNTKSLTQDWGIEGLRSSQGLEIFNYDKDPIKINSIVINDDYTAPTCGVYSLKKWEEKPVDGSRFLQELIQAQNNSNRRTYGSPQKTLLLPNLKVAELNEIEAPKEYPVILTTGDSFLVFISGYIGNANVIGYEKRVVFIDVKTDKGTFRYNIKAPD